MGELTSSDSPLGDLPRDATIVIAGPPMTGKYELLLRVLALHTDETVLISTRNAADRIRADLEAERGDRPGGRVGVIDCVNRPDGLGEAETELTKYVQSPENLTRIGVKFTELFEVLYEADGANDVGVGLHSISQLLMHSGLRSVYQFLQVLTGQVRSAEWLFVAVLDTDADEEDLQTLYHHFDGVVHTRENEGGEREFRIRGLGPTSSGWTAF